MTATFASGKVLTNTYDVIGRVTQRRLGLASNYDTVLTYKPGANSSQTALLATYKNGSDTAYAYEYDANGNITSITQGTVSVTYTYNDANELIRENNGFTNQTVTYAYDDWGNITEKKVYAYTTAAGPGTPTQTIPYVYGNSTWGDQLTSYNNQSISYDAMGNPTSYLGSTLTWEGKQLTGVGTTTYAYDENGLRTQKTVSGTTTNYYYNGSVLMSLVQGGNTLLFSYDAQGRAAAVNFNGTYYYYIRNGQGDVIKLIDNSKNTVVEYTYDTWGKQISCTGSLASTLGVLNPFRYRGYVYDEETNFYYLQSRYYDPTVGRFISADSQFDKDAGVCGYNLYAYCANNPINYYDAEGNSITLVCILVGAGIGLAIGTIAGISVATSNGYDPSDGWNYWKYVVGFGCIGTAAGALIGWGAGAIISALGAPAAVSSIPTGGGVAYKSFQQLKNAMGSAGAGMQWHHIVEQCQINRSGFPVSWIQNSNNVIGITTEIHRKVSAYYSQIQTFTNGMTFRDWVSQFSFEEQYEWGLYVLKLFGGIE